ncbi:MAG: ABC transporter substrate-binding protein [Lachnospiraceae bacterium]|nr:ABC transporter substrate-binding protein [Lachnospiraceae bacterium]
MKNRLKKVVALVGTMTLVMGMMTGCGSAAETATGTTASAATEAAAEGETIKIGAVVPLTGDVPALGESAKNGYQLAVDTMNANGGVLGKQVEIIFEDDENQPSKAPTVAQKLIAQDKVVGILGATNSKCSIPMGPICTQNKIPMVSPTSTNTKVTVEGGDYVFRACFIDPFQGEALANFAKDELGAQTAAVLYNMADDYSKGLAEAFMESYTAAGCSVVAEESYSTGESDFNAQLTNIKNENPDILVMTDFYSTVGLIAKQARTLGIEATFLGGDGWDSTDLVSIGGDAMEGAYYSVFYASDDTSEAVVNFKNSYAEAFDGKEADGYAALSYDAAMILMNAIENAGTTDSEKVVEALNSTDLDVVSGHVTYDESRNPIKPAIICTIKDGKAAYYTTVEPK